VVRATYLLAPSNLGLNSLWYLYGSVVVVAARASGHNCSHTPVKVLPVLIDTPEPLNNGNNDVKHRASE